MTAGAYAFSAGDAGAAVSISYGYIPQDVAQAALELAAERFRAAERIGLRSKSIGGQETIAYDISAISAPVMSLLQPYRRDDNQDVQETTTHSLIPLHLQNSFLPF